MTSILLTLLPHLLLDNRYLCIIMCKDQKDNLQIMDNTLVYYFCNQHG